MQINVTWIDIQDPESKVEDLADVVFRLLLATYPPRRTDRTVTVYPDVEGKGRLVEEIGIKDKLPWTERRMHWARVCLPLGAELPRVTTYWPLSHSEVMKYKVRQEDEDLNLPKSTINTKIGDFYKSLAGVPLSFPKPREKPQVEEKRTTTEPTPSGWKPFRVRTNAVFGHILQLNNANMARAIHEDIEALSNSMRTFNPVIPPLNEMNLPGWVPYRVPVNMTSLILMRFIPDSAEPLAPHLELRIKTTDDEIIELHSLRAVAHTVVSDILLPAQPVDVRTTQTLVAELPGNKVDETEGIQPLLQFLRDAKLNMAQGHLVTPPRVTNLGLPRWMFYRPEVDVDSPFLNNASQLQKRLDLEAEAAAARGAGGKTTVASDATVAKSKTKTKKTTADATATTSTTMNLPTTPYAPAQNGEDVPSYMEQRYAQPFNELRPVSYRFAGLELHRPLEATYDGWKLSYNSIEAGHGGGQRAELSLVAIPGYDRHMRRQPEYVDTQQFMRSVYRLAQGLETNPVTRKSTGRVFKSRIEWVGKGKKSERMAV